MKVFQICLTQLEAYKLKEFYYKMDEKSGYIIKDGKVPIGF